VSKLTGAIVRTLRSPGKYLDGHGLLLHVVAPDKRYWVFRYRRGDRERTMSLGSADVISLADARKLHTEARAMLARGIDPLAEREQAKAERSGMVTFAQAADAYIEAHRTAWRGRGESHWRQSLAMHVLPVLGQKAVGQVTVADVLKALTPLWTTKTPMAKIVRSRIELVLDFAGARGWRPAGAGNVATWRGNLRMLLPPPGKVHRVEHHRALPWREAPTLIASLGETGIAARCLAFLILTATRSGEARGARWDEIDMAQKLWVIPAQRMKAGREHRVPLSEPAMAILTELAELRTGDLVFFGAKRGSAIGDTTLQTLLGRLGRSVTVHGMRSTFRDWCADTGKLGDLAEVALAHVVGSAVARAYQRSDLLDARRDLMDAWAAYLTAPPAVVLPFQAAGGSGGR
jgi:integrase